MGKFSERQIFYQLRDMGVPISGYIKGVTSMNLYDLIGFEPKINIDGSRAKTPYEILKIAPIFVNGKEKPIVFAIKNKIKKIGNYQGRTRVFYYAAKKIKDEKDILSNLKTEYKRAIYSGDINRAKEILIMIGKLDNKEAEELIDSFFDYTRVYKSIKKQLMIDLFAHFFLMYINSISERKRKIKAKRYKRYLENNYNDLENDSFENDMSFNPADFGLGNIQKVTINDNENDSKVSFKFEKNGDIKKTGSISNINNSNDIVNNNSIEKVSSQQVNSSGVGVSNTKGKNTKSSEIESKINDIVKPEHKKEEKRSIFDEFTRIPKIIKNSILKRRKILEAKHFSNDNVIEKIKPEKKRKERNSRPVMGE